ncbi:FadR family transcriptional regulator [Streptosporangiaceae bacterium NEAU-GS5]|nr:FadR family transcriptional regulator [Streptosporangiaceae bacterium NEAU-GS5]
MTKIRALNRNSVVSDVVSQLLNYLVSERIGPGDKLPSERALSEYLGLGRSSVREAVKSLHLLGLLDVRQGDGTYLRGTESAVLPQILEWGLILGRPRTLDLIEARHQLEVFVARRAAERITPDGAAQLDACLERMAAAESRGSIEGCIEADIDFHLRLADLAGNMVIADMLRGIRVLLHVWMNKLAMDEGMTAYSEQHTLLADAVKAGDPDEAERVMRHHITSGGERLLRMLPPEEPLADA